MDNLWDLSLKGECLRKGQTVAMSLIPQMEVYGFLIDETNKSDIIRTLSASKDGYGVKLGPLRVVGNRVVQQFPNNVIQSYPIFESIERTNSPIQLQNIFLPGLLKESSYDREKYELVLKKMPLRYPCKFKDPHICIVEEEDGQKVPYYTLDEGQFLFSSASSMYGAGEYFLVICRRINNHTGEIIYEAYCPEDLFPIDIQ